MEILIYLAREEQDKPYLDRVLSGTKGSSKYECVCDCYGDHELCVLFRWPENEKEERRRQQQGK